MYYFNYNSTLVVPFNLRKDEHWLFAYNNIITRIKKWDQLIDLQILENEASAEYKKTMRYVWKVY